MSECRVAADRADCTKYLACVELPRLTAQYCVNISSDVASFRFLMLFFVMCITFGLSRTERDSVSHL